MSLNTNLDTAINTFNMTDAQIMSTVYFTEQGEAFTCSNWFSWMVHVIYNFFTGCDMSNMKTVFDQSLQEYYKVKAGALHADRVDDWSAQFQGQKNRLNFVLAVIQANQASFDAYVQNTPSQGSLAEYLRLEAPIMLADLRRRLEEVDPANVRRLQGAILGHEEVNNALEGTIQEMTEEQGRLQDAMRDMERQNREGATTIVDLRAQLDQARANLATANLHLQQAREYSDTLTIDSGRAIDQLTQANADLEAARLALQTERARLQANLQALQDDYADLNTQFQKFGTNATAIAESLRQISEYRALFARARDLELENTRLAQQIADNALQRRVDALKAQKENLDATIAANGTLIAALRQESGDRQIQIQTFKDEIQRIKGQYQTLVQSSSTDLRAQKEKTAKLEADLAAAQAEIKRLSDELSNAPTAGNPNLTQAKFEALREAVRKAEEALESSKKANQDITTEKEEVDAEIGKLKLANQTLTTEVLSLTRQVRQLRTATQVA